MDFVSPTPLSVLLLPVAILLFLLPGWLLARKLAAPSPLAAAFLGSSALLFVLMLLLHTLGVPLHAGTVGAAFALAALGLARFARRSPQSFAFTCPAFSVDARWLWLLPPALAVTSLALRALLDPLSGYDNGFRWDYLARLFLFRGSLAGYPPITSADFEYYSWCDGIPPLIPFLNFWIYAFTSSISPVLTSVRVIGEALLLGNVIHRYGQLLWGRQGGGPALAAISSSALALWSVAMGQETGLTALALVAMLYYLELAAQTPRRSLVFWAAIAAAIGALSREYGLAFPVLGAAILLATPRLRATLPLFVATVLALTVPWYARNAWVTGNPLYPHPLGGLFPGNAVHDESLRYFREYWSLDASTSDPSFIPRFLTVLCGVLVLLGLIGAWRAGRRGFALGSGVVLVVTIWFVLILPQAGAGWVYSARALSPALALLAVFSGWLATAPRWMRTAAALALSVAAVDAARRSWFLPTGAMASPWSASFDPWRTEKAMLHQITVDPVWRSLALSAAGKGVIVDHPASHALLTQQGGTAVPFFSPLLQPAFDPTVGFEDALQQLIDHRVKFITFSNVNPVTTKLVNAHAFWVTLHTRFQPNVRVGPLEIYELEHLEPAANP